MQKTTRYVAAGLAVLAIAAATYLAVGVRTPAGYLHRMLRTTWLDGQRRAKVGERTLASVPASSPGTPGFDVAIDLDRALGELPPLQREVVVLHLVEGCSFREVGERTGASMFTAAARYRLAIARLRHSLSPAVRSEV